VVGSPFVVSVTTDSLAPATYGLNASLDLLVAFSEPVAVRCGPQDASWEQAVQPVSAGAAPSASVFSSCPFLQLALFTQGFSPLSTNGVARLVADTLPQFALGADPGVQTSGPFDPPTVLRFRYTVRPFDTTCPGGACAPLKYRGKNALQLNQTKLGAGFPAGARPAAIVRVSDGLPAGHRLPPIGHPAGLSQRLFIQTPGGQVAGAGPAQSHPPPPAPLGAALPPPPPLNVLNFSTTEVGSDTSTVASTAGGGGRAVVKIQDALNGALGK